jgi:hypothetical protein
LSLKYLLYMCAYIFPNIWEIAVISLNSFSMALVCISASSFIPWILKLVS